MKPAGVLAIVGATATGKSSLAVSVAEILDGEIISADAFSAYRGLDVGTAKTTVLERRGIPHHLIDVKDPAEPFSAGEFGSRARQIAEEILQRGRLPILCGGSGFYIRSFFGGLFEGPTRDERLRSALTIVKERRGSAFLKRWVDLYDPECGARVNSGDAARAIRFLEIMLTTGRTATELFRERPGVRWEHAAVKVLLTLPRPVLYERIENRFQKTFAPELPGEVRRLLSSGVSLSCPGFSAIGYRETAELLEGRMDHREWEELILRGTRRFAKRQETWFRREPGLQVVRADQPGLVDLVIAAAQPLFSSGRPVQDK
ncbi:MAG: tRNA (adenosine(37)-N6)-dimethylallyltransferase MiaA [Thermoanaerobaculia bacterium]